MINAVFFVRNFLELYDLFFLFLHFKLLFPCIVELPILSALKADYHWLNNMISFYNFNPHEGYKDFDRLPSPKASLLALNPDLEV